MSKQPGIFLIGIIRAALVMTSVIVIYSALFGILNNKELNNTGIASSQVSASDPSFIQEKLKQLGFYSGEITGINDTETSEAVRRYQLYLGFDGSGIADEKVMEVLTGQPNIGYSEYDVYLLAQLIQAEAGKGSWFDMVMVGAEAVRRLDNSAYPDTLAGIIFEHSAYASAMNGSIWNEPSDKAIRAARDAMRGMLN